MTRADLSRIAAFLQETVSEPSTLRHILEQNTSDEKPTLIIDAGITSNENIELIKELGYNYICVSRIKPKWVAGFIVTNLGHAFLPSLAVASFSIHRNFF